MCPGVVLVDQPKQLVELLKAIEKTLARLVCYAGWFVRNVGEEIEIAAFEFQGIRGDKPLHPRAVVSSPKIVQPRTIILPSGELVRIRADAVRACHSGVSKGIVDILRLKRSARVAHCDS